MPIAVNNDIDYLNKIMNRVIKKSEHCSLQLPAALPNVQKVGCNPWKFIQLGSGREVANNFGRIK
jgi:hypothetical protein